MRLPLPDRAVVVSPHLDDGVLSLGASIASASRAGRQITVLTVFAGDPGSEKPAGGWDRRGGFGTEGAAVRARRGEDEAACGVVGAKPMWLGFSEADYRDTHDEDAVLNAVRAAASDAPAVLLPGFPLTNPDHAWVTDTLVRGELPCGAVGLYAEQPYRYWVRSERPRPTSAPTSSIAVLNMLEWIHLRTSPACLRTKRRAILEYRSQIPLLGLDRDWPSRLGRLLAHEALSRGEAIAWLPR
jgi:LmbE family N-acetylglucosaminyl deacetylase